MAADGRFIPKEQKKLAIMLDTGHWQTPLAANIENATGIRVDAHCATWLVSAGRVRVL